MKTQKEIKEQIVKEMQEIGYKLIPPMDFELIDVSEMDFEKRNSYYQNISKKAIELEFQKEIQKLKI